jgi:glycine cleavage system H lipoate-binding protein
LGDVTFVQLPKQEKFLTAVKSLEVLKRESRFRYICSHQRQNYKVNQDVLNYPALNQDPYGKAWLISGSFKRRRAQ